jgi:hypothetical protein
MKSFLIAALFGFAIGLVTVKILVPWRQKR